MSTTPVAVVAGAGGAGAATAEALAARGFHVVILDSHLPAAATIAEALVTSGKSAESHGIDLLDMEALTALRDALLEQRGRVDVLVHLVGGWRGSKTLGPSSVENWEALHPPIVGTLATLTAVFGESVKASGSGRVFMVTSTAATNPTAGNIAYAAAKSAAEAWMTGVAHYLRESTSSSVTVAVKALLTDQMMASDPQKEWVGFTHVKVLAAAIATASTSAVANGSRLDLTITGYSSP